MGNGWFTGVIEPSMCSMSAQDHPATSWFLFCQSYKQTKQNKAHNPEVMGINHHCPLIGPYFLGGGVPLDFHDNVLSNIHIINC